MIFWTILGHFKIAFLPSKPFLGLPFCPLWQFGLFQKCNFGYFGHLGPFQNTFCPPEPFRKLQFGYLGILGTFKTAILAISAILKISFPFWSYWAIFNFGCFEFYFKSCIHTIFLPHLLLARAISTF